MLALRFPSTNIPSGASTGVVFAPRALLKRYSFPTQVAGKVGQYVKLQLTKTGSLALAEVMVFPPA